MNIEQIAIDVAQEMYVGEKACVERYALVNFLRRCLSKLAEQAGVEPVAYQSTRNGFITKEDKNPEYNIGLYTGTQLIAAMLDAGKWRKYL